MRNTWFYYGIYFKLTEITEVFIHFDKYGDRIVTTNVPGITVIPSLRQNPTVPWAKKHEDDDSTVDFLMFRCMMKSKEIEDENKIREAFQGSNKYR